MAAHAQCAGRRGGEASGEGRRQQTCTMVAGCDGSAAALAVASLRWRRGPKTALGVPLGSSQELLRPAHRRGVLSGGDAGSDASGATVCCRQADTAEIAPRISEHLNMQPRCAGRPASPSSPKGGVKASEVRGRRLGQVTRRQCISRSSDLANRRSAWSQGMESACSPVSQHKTRVLCML